jgi:hypothetical protein
MEPNQVQSSTVIVSHKHKALWIVLGILLVGIAGYAYYIKHKKPALDPYSDEARLQELYRLGEVSSSQPISPEEQKEELGNLAGTSETTVTTEDQMNALNSLGSQ